MEIVLISFGSYLDKNYETIAEDFIKRIKRYYKFNHHLIDPRKKYKSTQPSHRKSVETDLILEYCKPQDLIILLDEKGREYTSRKLATQLDKWLQSGKTRLIFIIGGAYGFSEEVYQRSSGKLALSQMTLNHQIARLMWMEQLYRSCTILRGEQYHND